VALLVDTEPELLQVDTGLEQLELLADTDPVPQLQEESMRFVDIDPVQLPLELKLVDIGQQLLQARVQDLLVPGHRELRLLLPRSCSSRSSHKPEPLSLGLGKRNHFLSHSRIDVGNSLNIVGRSRRHKVDRSSGIHSGKWRCHTEDKQPGILGSVIGKYLGSRQRLAGRTGFVL